PQGDEREGRVEDEQRDEERREPVPPPHERADELAPLMPQQRKIDHEAASLLGASIRPGRRRPYRCGLTRSAWRPRFAPASSPRFAPASSPRFAPASSPRFAPA